MSSKQHDSSHSSPAKTLNPSCLEHAHWAMGNRLESWSMHTGQWGTSWNHGACVLGNRADWRPQRMHAGVGHGADWRPSILSTIHSLNRRMRSSELALEKPFLTCTGRCVELSPGLVHCNKQPKCPSVGRHASTKIFTVPKTTAPGKPTLEECAQMHPSNVSGQTRCRKMFSKMPHV